MSTPRYTEQNLRAVFPKFNLYHQWLRKALTLGLYSAGAGKAPFDRVLTYPRQLKGRMVGGFDRENIKKLRIDEGWRQSAAAFLESNAEDTDKEVLRTDLWAIDWTARILADLIKDESGESWRSDVEQEPLEGDQASGENDEARRGETLERVGNEKDLELQFDKGKPELATVELEVREQSQPEPAPPPAAPLSRAQEDEAPPEPNTEHELDGNLFVQNPEGAMRRASFNEGAIWLVSQCQAAYERLEKTTDLQEAANAIHAQRLANEWAEEIKADQIVRDRLNQILIRSLRRLGQIRDAFRKNGGLKRGKGAKPLSVRLDKHALSQSDKLAQIEEDEDFENRLLEKLRNGELTKYSTLQDPPAPKTPSKFNLFFRALKEISGDEWPSYAEGKYAKENEHEWAEITMGGRREKIRVALKKTIELLGPED